MNPDPNRTILAPVIHDPVFCTQCRAPIPITVSNAGNGLCPACIQLAQNMAAQAQQAAYQTNTGLGCCPQCRSTHVAQFDNYQPANSWPYTICAIAFGIFGFITLPLCGLGILFLGAAVLVFVMGISRAPTKIGTSRECRYCQFRWPV